MEQTTQTHADCNKGCRSASLTGVGHYKNKLLSHADVAALMAKIPRFAHMWDPEYQNLNPVPPILAMFRMSNEEYALSRREDRKVDSEQFYGSYAYNTDGFTNSNDQKTCIWSHGTCSWSDKSSGITWVGVHGKDSICVVTRSGDLDMTRVVGEIARSWPKHFILRRFRKSAISEIDDLVDPSSTLRERLKQSIKEPFGVVCVIPGTDTSPKESGHEAIEFLAEELKTDKAFSINETIQTAISAFQHLFQKKFEAEDIEVSVMDPNYLVEGHEKKDPTIEELHIGKIQDHLAYINKPCPEDYDPGYQMLSSPEDSGASTVTSN